MDEGNQVFKADGGKSRPTLLEVGFARSLRIVQSTLDYGAQKYEAHSWRLVEDGEQRYNDAARRHKVARDLGEYCDEESGLLHMAHEVFCILAQMELMLARVDPDQKQDWTTFNAPPQDHKRVREHDPSIHEAVGKIALGVKIAAQEPFKEAPPTYNPMKLLLEATTPHQQAQAKSSGPDVPYTTGRITTYQQQSLAAVEDAFHIGNLATNEEGYHLG